MTNGEVVSTILGKLKAVDKDGLINRRTIIKTAQTKARFLIAQKLDEGTLRKDSGVYHTLKCFPLRRVKSVDCDIVEFKRCDDLMKSVEKLPAAMFSRVGPAIDFVSNIDDSILYNPTTPRRYANSKKRVFSTTSEQTYYIKDGYLYLPDSTNEMVNISMIPEDAYDLQQKSTCSTDTCQSFWDAAFICPDRLEDFVLRATFEELIATIQIPKDENPNLDSNIKSQTTE